MTDETPTNSRYGAPELKRSFNRNISIAFVISVGLHLILIGIFLFSRDESVAPKRAMPALVELPHPPDTNWSRPILLRETNEGGGGSPDVDAPVGPAMKGHPDAVPDRTHSKSDPQREIIVKNPDKIRLVDKEKERPVVAGDAGDTSKRKSNVIGSKGQNPNGTGLKPAGGSGGTGVGYASGSGKGSRGWIVRPTTRLFSSVGEGSVTLRFTVMPNGDVTNITPTKRSDQALVSAAVAGLRRAKARPLNPGLPQVSQTETVTIRFVLK